MDNERDDQYRLDDSEDKPEGFGYALVNIFSWPGRVWGALVSKAEDAAMFLLFLLMILCLAPIDFPEPEA